MTLNNFNSLNKQQTIAELMKCNTSERWCDALASKRPFASIESLLQAADEIWAESQERDLLQAFDGHPEIGNVASLREKYRNTAETAGNEQSGVDSASEASLQLLSDGNRAYKDKFGFIFIVCATGKTADEMLALLKMRLPNTREQELINAAEEQHKITHIRIEKLIQ